VGPAVVPGPGWSPAGRGGRGPWAPGWRRAPRCLPGAGAARLRRSGGWELVADGSRWRRARGRGVSAHRLPCLAALPPARHGGVPRAGNGRRRLLWARVQGAPETQRPGEERAVALGMHCWGLGGSGALPRLWDSFIFLLTFLASSCWHRVIRARGTSGGLQSIPCYKQGQH